MTDTELLHNLRCQLSHSDTLTLERDMAIKLIGLAENRQHRKELIALKNLLKWASLFKRDVYAWLTDADLVFPMHISETAYRLKLALETSYHD